MINIEDIFILTEELKNISINALKEKNIGNILNENGHGSFLIEPIDKRIKKIILSFENNIINSIFIYADFKFNFSFLCEYFGKYREVYSPKDEEYIYYFNEFNDFTFYVGFRVKQQQNYSSKTDIDNIEIIYKKDL